MTLFWHVIEQNRRVAFLETSKKTRSQSGASQVPKRSPYPAPIMRARPSAQIDVHIGTNAMSIGWWCSRQRPCALARCGWAGCFESRSFNRPAAESMSSNYRTPVTEVSVIDQATPHHAPPSELTLRAATPDDVEAIATLWHSGWLDAHLGHVPESIRPHRRLVDFRERAPARVHATTVATLASCVVGFVTVHDDELEQIYVAESARGGGTAKALLRHAEQVIAARFDVGWLAVVAGNTRARRFYARHGWCDTGAFDYAAEITGGTMLVPCRRYEKKLTRASTPTGS